MGLFGFGGSKVDRYVKKLTNAYVQTHERVRMLDLLAETGTDEALYGILKRFTYRTEASIVDEDEKELAFKYLEEFSRAECGQQPHKLGAVALAVLQAAEDTRIWLGV